MDSDRMEPLSLSNVDADGETERIGNGRGVVVTLLVLLVAFFVVFYLL